MVRSEVRIPRRSWPVLGRRWKGREIRIRSRKGFSRWSELAKEGVGAGVNSDWSIDEFVTKLL